MNISNGNSFNNGNSMNLGGGASHDAAPEGQRTGGSSGGLCTRLLAVHTWRI